MVPSVIQSRLEVRRRDQTREALWNATPLESWTCTGCGVTDLFAVNPAIFTY